MNQIIYWNKKYFDAIILIMFKFLKKLSLISFFIIISNNYVFAGGMSKDSKGRWVNEQGGNLYGDSRFNLDADPRFNLDADPRYNLDADPRFNLDADPRYNLDADPSFSIDGDSKY